MPAARASTSCNGLVWAPALARLLQSKRRKLFRHFSSLERGSERGGAVLSRDERIKDRRRGGGRSRAVAKCAQKLRGARGGFLEIDGGQRLDRLAALQRRRVGLFDERRQNPSRRPATECEQSIERGLMRRRIELRVAEPGHHLFAGRFDLERAEHPRRRLPHRRIVMFEQRKRASQITGGTNVPIPRSLRDHIENPRRFLVGRPRRGRRR